MHPCPVQPTSTLEHTLAPSTSGNSLSPPIYFLFGLITGIMILLMMTIIPVGIMIFLKKSRAIQDRTSNQDHAMLPVSAEGTSDYYECIDQGMLLTILYGANPNLYYY